MLEALTSIWKILTSIDHHIVIVAWLPKVKDVLLPIDINNFMKAMTKKAVNDKFIELLQMGRFTVNKMI